jgi:ketosteroid isomerase-like protein
MSPHKAVVGKYIEGFRRTDHAQILSCLTDDVVWVLHGFQTLRGKAAFDATIENEAFENHPKIELGRSVEEGDCVAVTGSGSVAKKTAETMNFTFSEIFTFKGDLISRLETFHVWTK